MMEQAIFHFPTEGKPVECKELKSGHINKTYLVTTDTGTEYILQWINSYVFPNISAIMGNMSKISSYLKSRPGEKEAMISYIDTLEGEHCYNDGTTGTWRAYKFVDNSVSFQYAETPEMFAESARAFGSFQYALRDFPAETLEETIENFHNTPARYDQLRDALTNNRSGRAKDVRPEIDFLLSREERACRMLHMREKGELPVRVTHNDTKINNVLFDADTNKALCVIDLDTVMPGLSAFDYGDAIRFGASTAAEDERELDKVRLDLTLFRAFTHGFLESCPGLTEAEVDSLPLGAYTMTVETATRFLADHINGDLYFSIDREGHNLDRARTQIKLARDMEEHWDDLMNIVMDEKAKLSY